MIYSTSTAALLAPRPGAIRFDAPAAGNRPGRHGLWQRPVERRRLAAAALLVPWSEGGLAEAPSPHADAVVVPVPVEASGTSEDRDIAAITYGAHPEKKGLDRVLAAWAAARREGEELSSWPAWRGRDLDRGARFAGMLSPRASTARCCAARECSSPRRGARTTGSRSSRRWPTAARSSPPRRPGRMPRCPLARDLDPRLVTGDLATAIRAALDDPAPGYAERAAAALGPWRRERVDRVVADVLLPRLLD